MAGNGTLGPTVEIGEFYTEMGGSHGGEEKVSVAARLPQDLVKMMDIIVQSLDTPYETRADFIRDVVWAGIQAWQAKKVAGDPMLSSHVANEKMRRDSDAVRKHHKEADDRMRDVQEQLGIIVLSGDVRRAHQVIVEYWGLMTGIPVDYWRNHYVSRFTALTIVKGVLRLGKLGGLLAPPELLKKVGV